MANHHKYVKRVFGEQSGNDVRRCPVCSRPVRVVQRDGRHTDHYEPIMHTVEELGRELEPQDQETAAKLRDMRNGKKTVAIVGFAPTSCSKAPYDDPEVEIWGLNEAHAFSWMKRATRWFQIHASESWHRTEAKRAVLGHLDWLMTNPWNIPIYMQYHNDEVPNVIAYPLREVSEIAFKNIRRGDDKFKYFTSSFAYMMGIALLEGREADKPDAKPFERIEVYGFEMAATGEYIEQKGCAEFWMGLAMGMGIEIYLPPKCILMWSSLYGGNEQGAGW